MNEQIKQIAERLRGLRDVLELTAEDIARDSDISAEEYRLAETGDYDISVSMLQKIARTYNVALDALMFGEEPKMSSYFVTRAGKGISIERTKAYKYQSLASGFMNRTADPFIVTVEPKDAFFDCVRRFSPEPLCYYSSIRTVAVQNSEE